MNKHGLGSAPNARGGEVCDTFCAFCELTRACTRAKTLTKPLGMLTYLLCPAFISVDCLLCSPFCWLSSSVPFCWLFPSLDWPLLPTAFFSSLLLTVLCCSLLQTVLLLIDLSCRLVFFRPLLLTVLCCFLMLTVLLLTDLSHRLVFFCSPLSTDLWDLPFLVHFQSRGRSRVGFVPKQTKRLSDWYPPPHTHPHNESPTSCHRWIVVIMPSRNEVDKRISTNKKLQEHRNSGKK